MKTVLAGVAIALMSLAAAPDDGNGNESWRRFVPALERV